MGVFFVQISWPSQNILTLQAILEFMIFELRISGLFGVDKKNGFLETKFDVNNVFLSDAQLRSTWAREKCHGNKSSGSVVV